MGRSARLGRIVKELDSCRVTFGAEAGRRKLELVLSARKLLPSGEARCSSAIFERLHDTLLLLAAYPDNVHVFSAAHDCLAELPLVTSHRAFAERLSGSGIANTEIRYTFDSPILRWLTDCFPNDVSIDRENFDGEDRLQGLIPSLAGAAEESGIDDEDVSVMEWIDHARGPMTDATWIVSRLDAVISNPLLRDYLLDSLSIPIRWRIRRVEASRTGAFHPGPIRHYFNEPLERRVADVRSVVLSRAARSEKASPAEGARLLDLARSVLAAREREMYPISHGNARDVTTYDLGRGLRIVAYGILPERRFLLEGNWGFLFLLNGVPTGYGCFSSLFGSSEVAANIFETFRQGESAPTYARLLQVVRLHCGARAFSVLKYQFGDENEEAIEAGAFWFYHKLGFRHFSVPLRRIVRIEEEKIARKKGYRTPPGTLRKLATDNLYFHVEGNDRRLLGCIPYAGLGHSITGMIASRCGGNRENAVRECRMAVGRALGRRLPLSAGVDELCLFLEAGGGVSSWSRSERSGLAAIIRAKAEESETRFAKLTARHRRLREMAFKLMKKGTIAPS